MNKIRVPLSLYQLQSKELYDTYQSHTSNEACFNRE